LITLKNEIDVLENKNEVKEYKKISSDISINEGNLRNIIGDVFGDVYKTKFYSNDIDFKVLDKLTVLNQDKFEDEKNEKLRYGLVNGEIIYIYYLLKKYSLSKYIKTNEINDIINKLQKWK